MAAVSFSISRGQAGSQISDFTVGTSAPGSGDIELRVNTTDTNAKNLTRQDVVLALKGFIRAIEQGGNTTVGITNALGI